MSLSEDEQTTLFEQLAAVNRARLSGIARAYGKAHADDLLQEILLQIWRALPRLRDPTQANTWCYRIALNTAITWQRRQRRDKSVNVDDAIWATSAAPHAVGNDCGRQLDQFMDSLGEVDRALLLMLLDDLDYSSIAQITELSEGAVRVRIHRLKKKLADWEPLDS